MLTAARDQACFWDVGRASKARHPCLHCILVERCRQEMCKSATQLISSLSIARSKVGQRGEGDGMEAGCDLVCPGLQRPV